VTDRSGQEISLSGRPVALCGFMGSGKTTVGRRVADALGWTFSDCDELVETRLGRTISDLFAAGEESAFRREEAAVIADLVLTRPPGVLSLGGGALEDPKTRALVLGSTAAVHLDRPLEAILASLGRLRASRPLLAGRTDREIAELYSRRIAAFKQCPIRIAIGDLDVSRVVTATLVALAGHGIAPRGGE
jgi:shikimate kinase